MSFRGFFLFTVLAVVTAFGQTSDATLSGTVLDSAGGIIPGVAVTITNVKTGAQTVTSSNASGLFISPSLQPGEYRLTAEWTGFKKFVLNGVILNTGDKVSVNVTLNVGSV